MSFTISSFINALSWTLIHSFWQGALLYLLLKTALFFLKDSPARVRYGVSYLALAGLFIFFLLTFYDQWESMAAFSQETAFTTVGATTGTVLNGEAFSPVSFKNHFYENGLPYLAGLYMVGLFFFMLKVLRDLYLMGRIQNTGKKPFDPAWETYLTQLAKRWGISKKVNLYLSEKVDVPVVIGYFKPVIYLPFSLANHLPPEQIETILLHELAHIKRADFLINLLQTIVETFLFFNPFGWAISKMINKERELACDERVVAEKEPKTYAESLLALEENRRSTGKLVLAATHKKQQLFYRIKNIMEMKTKKFNTLQKLLVFAFIIITAFSISWLIPGKENHNLSNDKTQKSSAPLMAIHTKDTLPPAPTPPNPALTPATPAAPAGLQNQPPAPPVPPHPNFYIDSVPSIMDSALSGAVTGIQHYFNSGSWKKYMQSLKSYTSTLNQYYKSNDWKKYQKQLEDYGRKMNQYFNGQDWQKEQEAIRNQIQVLKRQFSGDTAIVTVTNGAKTVNTNRLMDKLVADGLLKNQDNYKIRLDNRGLFINGKKQPDAYYEKYRSMVGDHTKIKISKNKGTTSSSVSINR